MVNSNRGVKPTVAFFARSTGGQTRCRDELATILRKFENCRIFDSIYSMNQTKDVLEDYSAGLEDSANRGVARIHART